MATQTLAFVGAVGGAGTTRLTLECAALLASEGRDVAVLDAAYETQGLADRTPGRIVPDMTELCLGDEPLEEGLVDRNVEGAGRVAVCPARAPFERLARAKTSEAAESFGRRIDEAARSFDHVLVDTPPLAANQAVAAATTADSVAVVADAARAESAVPRTEDRLADVGAGASTTVVTRAETHPDADATVPSFEAAWPAVLESETARAAVAEVVASTLGITVAHDEEAGLRSKLSLEQVTDAASRVR